MSNAYRIALTRLVASLALLGAATADAAYDVAIVATGTSSGGSWAGDTWTASAPGATLLAAELESQLASAVVGTNVTKIVSTGAGGSEPGDILVAAPVSWSSAWPNSLHLTLRAHRNIVLSADLSAAGSAGLVLEYGQEALAAGNTARYSFESGTVDLERPFGYLRTKLGSDGPALSWTVITELGTEGSANLDLQGLDSAWEAGSDNYMRVALGADIDASPTSTWNGGAGFEPLGGGLEYQRFAGSFDGLGHTITGLTIDRPTEPNAGLFHIAHSTSLIRNLSLLDANVTG
jgi:hypothetical protein